MKHGLAAIWVCALLALTGSAQVKRGVTYAGHAKVAAAPSGSNLATGPDFKVLMMKRTAAGHVEVHARETDTFYVLDGEGILVTGGTMTGGKTVSPDQQRGESIQGGQTYRLRKGDFIVIPAGTPHWFRQVPRTISYYVVKAIKP